MRGVEAEHRIAPLKEGSKTGCWRYPVNISSRRHQLLGMSPISERWSKLTDSKVNKVTKVKSRLVDDVLIV